jgi:hypothetical protein
MIRAAVKKRLSMGADGLDQLVAACMACGHFLEVDTYDGLSTTPCPKCGRICYQEPEGNKHIGDKEDFELTEDFIQEKIHSMYYEVVEIQKEMPKVEQVKANPAKTMLISSRINTWMWEHHDPIIFFKFFDALIQGGAGELAKALENMADFDHKNLKEKEKEN